MRDIPSTSKSGESPAPRTEGRRRRRSMLAALGVVGLGLASTIVLVLVLVRSPLRKERMIRALLLEASDEVPKGCGSIHVCD